MSFGGKSRRRWEKGGKRRRRRRKKKRERRRKMEEEERMCSELNSLKQYLKEDLLFWRNPDELKSMCRSREPVNICGQ